MQFLDILDGSLSEAELSDLCRQFGVTFGAFPGASKRDKTREFLGYIRRQGRMAGLAEATVVLRPDLAKPVAQLFESKEQELAWLDQIAEGEGKVVDSGLTWRWAASSASRSADGDIPKGSVAERDNDVSLELNPPVPITPANPYTPGLRVTHDDMFFGRALERDHLRLQLAEGAHVAVVGGRGFGGSSLLHSAARSMGEEAHLLAAYIDMKAPANQTSDGLFNAIWAQWWGRVKPGNPVPVRSLAEFMTAVRKLSAARFRPLLFLDELEQLAWRPSVFDDNLFNAWHELGREGLMGFAVTAHSSPVDVLAQGEFNSKFYELFQQLDLGLLDETSARDLLAVPLQHAGLAPPEGAVDHLLAQAGPHPFFLHLAGLYLFESLLRQSYSRAGVTADFEAAATPFWQEIWDSLSPLAQTHYPPTRVRSVEGMAGRQTRILANKGLVIADETGFRPFSEGFAAWVSRMRIATEAAVAAVAGTMTA